MSATADGRYGEPELPGPDVCILCMGDGICPQCHGAKGRLVNLQVDVDAWHALWQRITRYYYLPQWLRDAGDRLVDQW